VTGATGPAGVTGATGPAGSGGFTPAYGDMTTPAASGTITTSYQKLEWVASFGPSSGVTVDDTTNYNFTINVAGVFVCDYELCLLESTTAHDFQSAIYYNNGRSPAYTSEEYVSVTATNKYFMVRGACTLTCAVNDTIDVRLRVLSGSSTTSNLNIESGGFRVYRIG
jgi:hypothetical protein